MTISNERVIKNYVSHETNVLYVLFMNISDTTIELKLSFIVFNNVEVLFFK